MRFVRIVLITAAVSILVLPVRAQSQASGLLAVASLSAQETRPELVLADLEGVPRRLSDSRGQIVVLNFWATWCVPCREEMPMLVAAQNDYAAKGVQVIGASADEAGKTGAVRRFVKKSGIAFPIWLGATTTDMERLGLGHTLPATIVFDRDGQPAGRILGMAKAEDLKEYLDWLLGDRQSPPPPPMINHLAATAHEEAGHDHEGEEHAHGGVGIEGASSVPS